MACRWVKQPPGEQSSHGIPRETCETYLRGYDEHNYHTEAWFPIPLAGYYPPSFAKWLAYNLDNWVNPFNGAQTTADRKSIIDSAAQALGINNLPGYDDAMKEAAARSVLAYQNNIDEVRALRFTPVPKGGVDKVNEILYLNWFGKQVVRQ